MSDTIDSDIGIKDTVRMVFITASFAIVLFVASSILLSSLSFILNHSITPYHFIASCIISISGIAFSSLYYFRQKWIPVFASSLCLIAAAATAAFMISVSFYDISWDGQAYHQEIIIQLAGGWNPVRHTENALLPEYSRHYASGIETCEAVIYSFTGMIEAGKACTIILIVAAALCASSFLLSFSIPVIMQVLLPLIVALNPVAWNQSLSYYVDGCLASLIMMMIILMGLLIRGAKGPAVPLLACAAAAMVTVKFPAVPYAVVLFGGFGGYYLLKRNWRGMLTAAAAGTAAFVLGICIMGFHPYVTNLASHGHPFYPYYGNAGKNMSLSGQVPEGYRDRNNISHLFFSTFSETGHDMKYSNLKIPFTFSKKEIKQFFSPAVRIGGFGPLFGGAVICTIISLGALAVKRSRYAVPAIGAIVVVLVSVIINPACWWARFVPQYWMVPCIALFFLMVDPSRISRALSVLLAAAMMLNIVLVSYTFLDVNWGCSRAIRKQMKELKDQRATVRLYFDTKDNFYSNRIRFMEAGIPVQEAPLGSKPPASGIPILGSTTIIEVVKK